MSSISSERPMAPSSSPPALGADQVAAIIAQVIALLRPRQLTPWEEITYFQNPLWTNTNIGPGNPWVPICKGNPQRVALIVSATGSVNVTTDTTISTSAGIALVSSYPVQMFRQSETGPLCTLPWYAASQGGVSLTTVEILLREWPDNSR